MAKNHNSEPDYDGSLVLRMEDLLAGKNPVEMIASAENLGKNLISEFNKKLKVLWDELSSMFLEEDEVDEKTQQVKKLLSVPKDKLSDDDFRLMLEAYDEIIHSVEFNMSRLGIYPQKDIFYESEIAFEALRKRSDVYYFIKDFLKKNLGKPKRQMLKDKIEALQYQINCIESAMNEKFCLAVDRDFLFNNFSEVHKALLNFKKKYGADRGIELVVDNVSPLKLEKNNYATKMPYFYSKPELKKLIKLYSEPVSANFNGRVRSTYLLDNIYFSEFYTENFLPCDRKKLWSFDEVARANNSIHEVNAQIKKLYATPLESLLDIRRHISDGHKYHGVATNDERTRSFLSEWLARMNNMMDFGDKAFVCTSFSLLAKAQIDDLNNPNLKAKLLKVNFYLRNNGWIYIEEGSAGFHTSHYALLIDIRDDFYGVKGKYIWDPTWTNDNLVEFLCMVEEVEHCFDLEIVDEEINESRAGKYLLDSAGRIENKTNPYNSFYLNYAGGSQPIPLETYFEALKSLYTKIQKKNSYHTYLDAPARDKSPRELALDIMNNSFDNMFYYYYLDTSNVFYEYARQFFERHKDKFPDWTKKFQDYKGNVRYEE